jgi:phosphatidylglycerol:prolipoprotein diacylglycerol transferase
MNWSYAAIMLLAIATGAALSRVTQSRLPLTWGEKLGIGIGAFCGCMIGAKLPFVLADWDGMASGYAWFADGKTIMCGLVGGYLGVELAKWALEIRTKTGDSFAVPVAAAVAIGRLGCFQAGCCFGTPTSLPWGVAFPLAGDNLPRHPTQLYETAFHALAAVVLFVLWRRQLLRGQLIKVYIIGYLVYRFVTEFIRPEPQLWIGLSVYQWAALALLPVFVGLWILDARKIGGRDLDPNTIASADQLLS